jgi:hypothetical protein
LSILKTTDVNQRPGLMIFLESFQTSCKIVRFVNSALSLKATNEIAPAEHPDDPQVRESVPEGGAQLRIMFVPFRDGFSCALTSGCSEALLRLSLSATFKFVTSRTFSSFQNGQSRAENPSQKFRRNSARAFMFFKEIIETSHQDGAKSPEVIAETAARARFRCAEEDCSGQIYRNCAEV